MAKRFVTFLYEGDVSPPTVAINRAKIGNGTTTEKSILVFPYRFYDMTGLNQMILRWYLRTMPTGATFVKLLPISFDNMVASASSAVLRPGTVDPTTAQGSSFDFAQFTFDELDTTNNVEKFHPYALEKTAADSTLTIGGKSYVQGTRYAIPIAEDYVGFYVSHDGTNNTGDQTILVTLSYS